MLNQILSKNAKNYHKLINSGRKQTNEVDYFKRKLSNKQQPHMLSYFFMGLSHFSLDELELALNGFQKSLDFSSSFGIFLVSEAKSQSER